MSQACGANTDCISGICAAGTCSSGLPSSGLIGYWNFEQASPTVTDLSGNGNNGTNFGASQGPGKLGQGYTFTNGDCIGIPNSTSLQMIGGSSLTMMAWGNYSGGCSSDRGEIINKENTYESAAACDPGNEYQNAIQTTTSGGWSWAGTGGITLNTWHLFATTWDGTTALEYIDGVQVSTRAIPGVLSATATGLGIGCRSVSVTGSTAGAGSYWIGSIDEVSIYNRALAPSEITTYYNATK